MKFVLTSCGLSLLTNYLREEYDIPNKEVYKYSNSNENEIDGELKKRVDEGLEKLKKEIVNLSYEKLKKLSAELNALLSFY